MVKGTPSPWTPLQERKIDFILLFKKKLEKYFFIVFTSKKRVFFSNLLKYSEPNLNFSVQYIYLRMKIHINIKSRSNPYPRSLYSVQPSKSMCFIPTVFWEVV